MNVEIFAFFLTMVLNFTNGQSLSDAKTLQTDLFNGYKKGVKPILNQSEVLNIGVIFFLTSFNSFQEVTETISITAGIGLNWTDPSLVWDPSSYGNIESTIIDSAEIWIPPIFLVNSVDSLEPIGKGTKFYTTIFYNGQVAYSPGGILLAKCPTDISKFPFDTQICTFNIAPWGINVNHLRFSSVFERANLDFFTPHADWTLEEYTTQPIVMSNTFSAFSITLKIKRQPLYYVVMIILPTLLFSLLNPLVFMLPVESGERISLAMTILLSYAIFLTLVSASIPTSSNPMCVLLVIMIVIIAISGIILVGAILSAKYYYHVGSVGRFISFFVERCSKNSNDIVPIDEKQEIKSTGSDVSRCLDSIFFYGSYVVIILCVIGYFLYVTM